VWLPKLSSTRHPEPAHPQVSQVGDLWLYRGLWHDVCCRPGLAGHASASLCCWNKPADGGDHGRLPDLVGLLRTFDFVAVIAWNLVAILVNLLNVAAYVHFVNKEKANHAMK
jgi:hypothetical protein